MSKSKLSYWKNHPGSAILSSGMVICNYYSGSYGVSCWFYSDKRCWKSDTRLVCTGI